MSFEHTCDFLYEKIENEKIENKSLKHSLHMMKKLPETFVQEDGKAWVNPLLLVTASAQPVAVLDRGALPIRPGQSSQSVDLPFLLEQLRSNKVFLRASLWRSSRTSVTIPSYWARQLSHVGVNAVFVATCMCQTYQHIVFDAIQDVAAACADGKGQLSFLQPLGPYVQRSKEAYYTKYRDDKLQG